MAARYVCKLDVQAFLVQDVRDWVGVVENKHAILL